jgi:hypothetical protein
MTDCDFNRAALHPAYPIKRRTSTQRTQAPESVDTRRAFALDPLENNIRPLATFRATRSDLFGQMIGQLIQPQLRARFDAESQVGA